MSIFNGESPNFDSIPTTPVYEIQHEGQGNAKDHAFGDVLPHAAEKIRVVVGANAAPMGPASALDLIVVSAAKNAADAALAAANRLQSPPRTPSEALTSEIPPPEIPAQEIPPPEISSPTASNINSPGITRRPRAKLVAAKSVLTSAPRVDRRTMALKRSREIRASRGIKETSTKKKASLAAKKAPPLSKHLPPVKKVTHQKASASLSKKMSPVKKVNQQKTPISPSKKISPVKKVTPKKTATSTTRNKKVQEPIGVLPAREIWHGAPDDTFEYSWKGWTKKTFQRQSGKTKGLTDSYWYTPKMQYRLRSLTEVRRFVNLKETHTDEESAWKALKGKL